jgi:hypothetical protein
MTFGFLNVEEVDSLILTSQFSTFILPMNDERRFVPEIGAKIVVYAIWSVMFCVFGYAYFYQSGPLTAVVLSGLALTTSVLWMRGISISTSYDGVTVGTEFWRSSSLFWSDIGEVTTTAKINGTGQTLSTTYHTTLRSNTPSKNDIRINIKQYGKRDLMEFASILLRNLNGATIDEATRAISEGQMPSAFGIGKRRGK